MKSNGIVCMKHANTLLKQPKLLCEIIFPEFHGFLKHLLYPPSLWFHPLSASSDNNKLSLRTDIVSTFMICTLMSALSEAIVTQVLDELGVEIGDQVITGDGAHNVHIVMTIISLILCIAGRIRAIKQSSTSRARNSRLRSKVSSNSNWNS